MLELLMGGGKQFQSDNQLKESLGQVGDSLTIKSSKLVVSGEDGLSTSEYAATRMGDFLGSINGDTNDLRVGKIPLAHTTAIVLASPVTLAEVSPYLGANFSFIEPIIKQLDIILGDSGLGNPKFRFIKDKVEDILLFIKKNLKDIEIYEKSSNTMIAAVIVKDFLTPQAFKIEINRRIELLISSFCLSYEEDGVLRDSEDQFLLDLLNELGGVASIESREAPSVKRLSPEKINTLKEAMRCVEVKMKVSSLNSNIIDFLLKEFNDDGWSLMVVTFRICNSLGSELLKLIKNSLNTNEEALWLQLFDAVFASINREVIFPRKYDFYDDKLHNIRVDYREFRGLDGRDVILEVFNLGFRVRGKGSVVEKASVKVQTLMKDDMGEEM